MRTKLFRMFLLRQKVIIREDGRRLRVSFDNLKIMANYVPNFVQTNGISSSEIFAKGGFRVSG